MQADSDALRRSAGSQPMGLPIGDGFTHDFALCRSAGAVRYFHRLRHAFSVQMVWYLSLTYGQAHRLSSGTPSACLFYTQKIRNRAAHTLFDSFATAHFFLTSDRLSLFPDRLVLPVNLDPPLSGSTQDLFPGPALCLHLHTTQHPEGFERPDVLSRQPH